MVKLKGYPLLNNINMLYFVFILAIINIGGFIYIKDNQSIFLFACISIIIYFFNNNMIIVLLSTMIIINILIFINKLNGPIEGYTNDDEDPTKESLINEDDEEDPKKIKESLINEDEEEPIKESLINEDDDEDNAIGELSEINDETETNIIKEKIKKVMPILKTTYNTISSDINNINKHINNLTSILE
jgi:hypothetical protein